MSAIIRQVASFDGSRFRRRDRFDGVALIVERRVPLYPPVRWRLGGVAPFCNTSRKPTTPTPLILFVRLTAITAVPL